MLVGNWLVALGRVHVSELLGLDSSAGGIIREVV